MPCFLQRFAPYIRRNFPIPLRVTLRGTKGEKGIRGTDAACAAVGIADSPPRCDLRVANAASARHSQMPSQDVRQRAWVPAERHMKRDGGEKPSVPIETVDAAVIEATAPAVRGSRFAFAAVRIMRLSGLRVDLRLALRDVSHQPFVSLLYAGGHARAVGVDAAKGSVHPLGHFVLQDERFGPAHL